MSGAAVPRVVEGRRRRRREETRSDGRRGTWGSSTILRLRRCNGVVRQRNQEARGEGTKVALKVRQV